MAAMVIRAVSFVSQAQDFTRRNTLTPPYAGHGTLTVEDLQSLISDVLTLEQQATPPF